ncbi:nucleotidyl transferase AbiEii/AbiGii toxin family protein [Kribbella catacumbae]|uniref:nucleotidyl transferase AbiEii/AbiGii toxin family protein n=1 Tax=Kribbella catacumbae TaxID=460086 RepID=UPI00037819D3|nr:nucleotidyl transferase AbiEii/AbiGii toxin family protein [Kribbella catacumbae]
MRDKPYATAREFRVSANAHMKRVAVSSGRPPQEINREFVLQRFLARIFQHPDAPWVLKGGTGLLVRLPRARYSDDVDLLYSTDNIDLRLPITELHTAAARPCGSDFFRFELGRVDERTTEGADKAVATVRVLASIGTTAYQRFSIDLSVKKRSVTAADRVRPTPVIVLPGVPELPDFLLYPLADQIADKVCPAMLTSPGRQWPAGYLKEAVKGGLSAELHDLDQALGVAGSCLDPLLGGEITDGTWDISEQRWQ